MTDEPRSGRSRKTDGGTEASGSESDSSDGDTVGERTDLAPVISQFYRAEMDRVTVWRQRLDDTTTWTVTIVAALLAYGFSTGGTHTALLAGVVVVTSFLAIDARRYQDYDVWRSRVRLLQKNFYADALDPTADVQRVEWRHELGEDLRTPTLKIPYRHAFARRLRRVYLPLLAVLVGAWVVRVTAFVPGEPVRESAAVGSVSGRLVLGAVAAFSLVLLAVALLSQSRTEEGEVADAEDYGQWKDADGGSNGD